MGGLLGGGGGGAKDMLAPPLKLLGGGAAPGPPLPTPMPWKCNYAPLSLIADLMGL